MPSSPSAEGASAFEEIKQTSFDLLLTDIVMPEMDGIELARRAAELDPSLKIMFITGFAAVALHPDSRAPKDAKVLSKPFHLGPGGRSRSHDGRLTAACRLAGPHLPDIPGAASRHSVGG